MNIFYLDHDPVKAAKMMTDRHVVKMIVESAQLLCTNLRMLDGTETTRKSKSGSTLKYWALSDSFLEKRIYKPTHYNHPSAIWVRQSDKNYEWLYKHFKALNEEYKTRFGEKDHYTVVLLDEYIKNPPVNIPKGELQKPNYAMPEQYRVDNPVQSYRNYYEAEKLIEEKDIERYNRLKGE